jgi:hypothetical protein
MHHCGDMLPALFRDNVRRRNMDIATIVIIESSCGEKESICPDDSNTQWYLIKPSFSFSEFLYTIKNSDV